MAYYIFKLVATAGLIVSVSEIAKRSSFLGGLIASLPIISLLSIMWLYIPVPRNRRLAATIWYRVVATSNRSFRSLTAIEHAAAWSAEKVPNAPPTSSIEAFFSSPPNCIRFDRPPQFRRGDIITHSVIHLMTQGQAARQLRFRVVRRVGRQHLCALEKFDRETFDFLSLAKNRFLMSCRDEPDPIRGGAPDRPPSGRPTDLKR